MSAYRVLKEQIVATAQRLTTAGYLMATGGNLSVRSPGATVFAVTPSNMDYMQMAFSDVCILDLDLNVLEGERKPSIESGLHAGVYRARPDVNAVVHTHQMYASALSLIDAPIPALFDEQVRYLGRSVEIIPYALSGTGLLKGAIARRVRGGANAYVMKNHGALCFGPDLERAAHNVEILEKSAMAYLLALCTERRVDRIPLPVRELILTRLRADQKKAEQTAEREARTTGGSRVEA